MDFPIPKKQNKKCSVNNNVLSNIKQTWLKCHTESNLVYVHLEVSCAHLMKQYSNLISLISSLMKLLWLPDPKLYHPLKSFHQKLLVPIES